MNGVRTGARVLDDISRGRFLAQVLRGSEVPFEQIRVSDEIWMSKELTVRADARVLFKHVAFGSDIAFSDFHKYPVGFADCKYGRREVESLNA